jgi:hypothetical protein
MEKYVIIKQNDYMYTQEETWNNRWDEKQGYEKVRFFDTVAEANNEWENVKKTKWTEQSRVISIEFIENLWESKIENVSKFSDFLGDDFGDGTVLTRNKYPGSQKARKGFWQIVRGQFIYHS